MYTTLKNKCRTKNKQSGLIMPMVAFSLLLIFSFLAFSIDIMYEIYYKNVQKFYCETCNKYIINNLNYQANYKNLGGNIKFLINQFNLNFIANSNFANKFYITQNYQLIQNSSNPLDFSLRTQAQLNNPYKASFLNAVSLGKDSYSVINIRQSSLISPQPARAIVQSNNYRFLPIVLDNNQLINSSTSQNYNLHFNLAQSVAQNINGVFCDLTSLNSSSFPNQSSSINNITSQLNSLVNLNATYLYLQSNDYLTSYSFNFINSNQNLLQALKNIQLNITYLLPVTIINNIGLNGINTYQIIGFASIKIISQVITPSDVIFNVQINQSSYYPNSSLLTNSVNNSINNADNFALRNYQLQQSFINYSGIVFAPMHNYSQLQDMIFSGI